MNRATLDQIIIDHQPLDLLQHLGEKLNMVVGIGSIDPRGVLNTVWIRCIVRTKDEILGEYEVLIEQSGLPFFRQYRVRGIRYWDQDFVQSSGMKGIVLTCDTHTSYDYNKKRGGFIVPIYSDFLVRTDSHTKIPFPGLPDFSLTEIRPGVQSEEMR